MPVRTINAGPNPRYFGRRCSATWLNVIDDRVMGVTDTNTPAVPPRGGGTYR